MSRNVPCILVSASRPSVGRTLVASLLATRLSQRHNVLLADWDFDQSPLLRYFDVEHLAVVHSAKAGMGLRVSSRLILCSSSHSLDKETATVELDRRIEDADIAVIVLAGDGVPGLSNAKVAVCLVVFDYQVDSPSKAGLQIKRFSTKYPAVYGVPSWVDRSFPQIQAQRQHSRKMFREVSVDATVAEMTERLELPLISGRARLFDLASGTVEDPRVDAFAMRIANQVEKNCSLVSSSAFAEEDVFPTLVDGSVKPRKIEPLPPLAEFPDEELVSDLPPKKPFHSEDELPEEPENLALEGEPETENPHADLMPESDHDAACDEAEDVDMSGPESELSDQEDDKAESAETDGTVDEEGHGEGRQVPVECKADKPEDGVDVKQRSAFPVDRLEEWAGIDLGSLVESLTEAIVATGLSVPDDKGNPIQMFIDFNRKYEGWSDLKRCTHWSEAVLSCLSLCDIAYRQGSGSEMVFRERTEQLFSGLEARYLNDERVRVMRMINLVALLRTYLSVVGPDEEVQENMTQVVLKVMGMESSGDGKVAMLRKVALGLAARMPSLQTEEERETRERFEAERDDLPQELRKLFQECDVADKVVKFRKAVDELII